jgi:hypothetical protein
MANIFEHPQMIFKLRFGIFTVSKVQTIHARITGKMIQEFLVLMEITYYNSGKLLQKFFPYLNATQR